MGHQDHFSTDVSNIDTFKTVYVNSLNVFPDSVSNIITLEDTVKYILTRPINTGILQFATSAGGTVEIVSSNEGANNWTTELIDLNPLFIGDFGRLQMLDIDLISATGTSGLFDIVATTASRPVLAMQRNLIRNFGTLGTLEGMSSFNTSQGIVNCDDGITLINPGAAAGAGISWNSISFVGQKGDHITVIGDSDFLIFDIIGAAPQTGDQVFNLDQANNTVATFIGLAIDTTGGGETGLEQTIDSDTVLGSIFPVINVDTSSNTVKVTLPNIDGVGIQNGSTRTLIDLGNAGTNNIEVVPFSVATTKVMTLERFVMDVDNQSVIFEVAGDQWVIDANTDNYLVQFSTGFTGGTAETVLNDTSTFVKIAGVYVNGDLTRTSATDGVVTSEGFLSTTVDIHANAELLLTPATETDTIEIALFRNNAEVADSRTQKTLDAVFQAPSSPSFNVKANIPWEEDDTLDLRIRNISNPTNITATDAKIIGDRG
ncbi:MAG: hypothetical protein V3V81_07355 [Candidatus Bathyarchaeia archaeon]